MRLLIVGAIALLIPAWSSTQQPETLSLLEKPLYRPPVSKGERTRLAAEIEAARKAVAAEPSNPEAVLRLAQAQMALGALGEAMISLSRAIEGNVDDPRLRLARGHGFIDIRKFDLAIRDFRNAAATIPAARCDVAFAIYLTGDFSRAHQEYAGCPDPGFFGYLAARRSGAATGDRPVPPPDRGPGATDITLPGSTLPRDRMAAASMGAAYLDAVDRLIAGDTAKALDLLKLIVEKHKDSWMEPVYVAAESDYARMLKAQGKKKRVTGNELRVTRSYLGPPFTPSQPGRAR